jgi:hypothetical protein
MSRGRLGGLYVAALWLGWLLPPASPIVAIAAGLGALIGVGLVGKAVGVTLARRRRQAVSGRFV